MTLPELLLIVAPFLGLSLGIHIGAAYGLAGKIGGGFVGAVLGLGAYIVLGVVLDKWARSASVAGEQRRGDGGKP